MIYSCLSYLDSRKKHEKMSLCFYLLYVLSTILHLPFTHQLTARASGGFPAVLIATPSKLSSSPVCDNDATTSFHSIHSCYRC